MNDSPALKVGDEVADAARAGQKNRVGHTVGPDRIAQGDRDVGLSRDVVEAPRTPFSCQDLVTHGIVPQLARRIRAFAIGHGETGSQGTPTRNRIPATAASFRT